MHSAPSVNHPVGRSLLAGALILCAQAIVLAACFAFWTTGAQTGRLALVVAAAAASIMASTLGWLRMPVGTLGWDGATWTWGTEAQMRAGIVKPVLDLQRLLLVQWKSDASSHWLWLERGRDAGHWHAVRRAVYSRARPEAPQGATSPAANP